MPQRLLRLAGRSEIGDTIRTARVAAGRTQTQLAIEVGSTENSVVRWELGYAVPNGPFVARLVRALPDHADDLLDAFARADGGS